MSSASPMVQKKMAELETELSDVYSRPLDPTAEDPRRRMSFEDIKQRFSFLGKLLAAEIESQADPSDELEEINQKLTQLEAEFDKWNKSKSCIFDNPIDLLEVCDDCTQAILHDDEDDGVESVSEAADDFSSVQQSVLKTDERERGERKVRKRGKQRKGVGLLKRDRRERRERREKKKRKKGGYWEAFGYGMIVGALIISLMMQLTSSTETGGFLLPPT